MLKRILALMLVLLTLSFSLSFFAAAAQQEVANDEVVDEADDDETQTPTKKPTEPPTEPPLTPETYGYKGYAEQLDKTVYDQPMGALYSKESTTFKVWAPTAEQVKVNIYKTGSDEEQGAEMLSSNLMKFSPKVGAWHLTLKGDYKNLYYTYVVSIEGTRHEVVDPYAKAVGVNGNRGMIIDLDDTDPKGWDKDTKFKRVSNNTDAIVWELNIRDFSASESSGVSEKNRGKYLAFTETDTKLKGDDRVSTCVAYLKELGVNYVQINPFFDFESIDESVDLSVQYNWGYDPKNFNAPEGSYASDPYDGRVRIKECKQMIKALHDAGIGVIMDVVYNHTFSKENSFFNQLVPYYYYRINEDGSWSNGSGCGNDIASERYMVREFIKNSVEYWAKEYHIDGFRFDLMGLTDCGTMAYVRRTLDKLKDGKHILTYGEGWSLETSVDDDEELANQNHLKEMSQRIAAFNDTTRDAIKGNAFNKSEKGFVQQGSSKAGIRSGVLGMTDSWAAVPNQCVNYASCHDNMTLYDKLMASVYNSDDYHYRREDLVKMNKLSAAIVLMSRGMAFMLAGEEMGRTKEGDENSYKSPVEINQIDWTNAAQYASVKDYYKGLIQIRKAFNIFRDPDGKRSKIAFLDDTDKDTIAYTMTNPKSKAKALVIFNGSPDSKSTVKLPKGDWVLLADGNRAGLTELGSVSKKVTVSPSGSMVLIDRKTYNLKKSEADTDCYVYVRYKDTVHNSIAFETLLKGKKDDSFSTSAPEYVKFNYTMTGEDKVEGVFSKQYETIDVNVLPYEGNFSNVTIHFIDEENREIANELVLTNRIGQQYFTPSIPGVKGYVLDLDHLPTNGAGVFTDDPIEVFYRYEPDEEENADISPEYSCRANVIYMADDGVVLAKKSYMGVPKDEIEIDYLEFKDYEYLTITEEHPKFFKEGTNVVLYYHHKAGFPFQYIILAAAIILAVVLVIVLVRIARKKQRMHSIYLDE